MALEGKFAPAGPMLRQGTVLPVLAPPVEVLIRIFPLAAATVPVDEPSTEQFVTELDAGAVDETNGGTGRARIRVADRQRVGRDIETIDGHNVCAVEVDEGSGDGAAHYPRPHRACTVNAAQLLTDGWFKTAEAVSTVSQVMVTVIILPACVVSRFNASKAAFNVG